MKNRTRSYIVFIAFLALVPTSFGLMLAYCCGPFNRNLPIPVFISIILGISVFAAGSVVGAIFALFKLYATGQRDGEPVISGNLGRYVIAGFGLLMLAFKYASKTVCS